MSNTKAFQIYADVRRSLLLSPSLSLSLSFFYTVFNKTLLNQYASMQEATECPAHGGNIL